MSASDPLPAANVEVATRNNAMGAAHSKFNPEQPGTTFKIMPKYSTETLNLINALQAAERINGCSVILTLQAAARIAKVTSDDHIKMFNFEVNDENSYAVTLKETEEE